METFENSIGMAFVRLPAGIGVVGSPPDEPTRRENEGPQYHVEISSFCIARFQTTQAQYSRLTGVNPSFFSASGGGHVFVVGLNTGDFPVECVSWYEASDFCATLSSLPEEQKKNRFYRLPTEVEWEYACRGGKAAPFSSGPVFTSQIGNIDGRYPYGCGKVGPTLERTCAVGSYPPNAFGLWDMHGNVWEWCADWYTSDYSASCITSCSARVLRGGSWACYSRFCRSAYRSCGEAAIHYYDQGFRVVCDT